jgi:hypothetical protein
MAIVSAQYATCRPVKRVATKRETPPALEKYPFALQNGLQKAEQKSQQ